MTIRKATFGLSLICTMLVSVVAASSASASSATAVTAGGTTFTGATAMSAETEGFTFYQWTTGGMLVKIEIPAVSASLVGENSEPGGVMQAEGVGAFTYLGVSANHGCLVNGEKAEPGKPEVTTHSLKFRTLSTTQLKFEPALATPIVEFTLEGCDKPFLNRTWTITGSVIGTPSGAETFFTHMTTTGQGTLKANGSITAGLEGALKLKGENGNGLEFQ